MGLDRSSLTVDHHGRVVVHAKEVDRCGNGCNVAGLGRSFDPVGNAVVRTAEVWIAALEQRVEVKSVLGGIGSQRCSFSIRTVIRGVARGKFRQGPIRPVVWTLRNASTARS